MTSEWDGTAWGGAPVKAITGPFASRVEYGTPLASLQRTPQRRMREAQILSKANPWIRAAEAVVTRAVVGLGWHLETPDDEEVPDNAAGVPGEIIRLLERPQAMLENVGRKLTRRQLWALTSRHIGVCGMSYWYLDQMTAGRLPLGILPINPARMWAATDEGDNLLGWVLDAKDETGRGGIPLSLDEVLPFYLDPPDAGHYGSGLVEAAWLKAQITTLADRHAAYILEAGGRLPGLVSPKEGTIPEEQYVALVKEFRNLSEAVAANRTTTTILRGPIDFTATSADPAELTLLDLSKMNRDDIFAIWGVPPSQAGISMPAGLNSGDTKKYDEAVLMQGAVHDRVVSMRETIQYGLLDRWQQVGVSLDLEVEEPEFDDDTPAYENAQRALNMPLKNWERRAIIGLDPTGDLAFDDAVLLPITLTPYDASAPPEMPEPPEMTPQDTMMQTAKAAGDRAFLGLRAKMEVRWVPSLQRSVQGVLRAQRAHVAQRLRDHGEKIARKPGDTTLWWEPKVEDERLAKVLAPGAAGIALTVARQIGDLMETPAKAAPVAYEDAVTTFVGRRTGERVTKINETTRDAIRAAITEAFEQGLSPLQAADLMEELPAFDAYRAELVARTETMFAYNDAALTSYREFGVSEVLAYDGDGDEECAARNGRTFGLEESYGITDHPNGTLDWAPVVGRAYWDVPAKAEPTQSLRIDVGEAPIVNVAPPVVNVAAPIVNIDMSELTAAMKALGTRQPRITRDEQGRIVGLEMVTS